MQGQIILFENGYRIFLPAGLNLKAQWCIMIGEKKEQRNKLVVWLHVFVLIYFNFINNWNSRKKCYGRSCLLYIPGIIVLKWSFKHANCLIWRDLARFAYRNNVTVSVPWLLHVRNTLPTENYSFVHVQSLGVEAENFRTYKIALDYLYLSNELQNRYL